MSAEWFNEQLNKVDVSSGDSDNVLLDVKAKLSLGIDGNLIKSGAIIINVLPCFACLQGNVKDDTAELASDVACSILELMQPEIVFSSYGAQICSALGNTNAKVKRSFLKLILNLTSDNGLFFSFNNLELLSKIIECLACPDRNVAEGAVQIFKQAGKHQQLTSILFSEQLVTVLKRLMLLDDIARFRIYEIIVDVSVKQENGLELAHASGILPALLEELKSSDVLIKLNVLELLTVLTTDHRGLLYLQRQGVIKFLVGEIINSTAEPLSFILLPGVIEFFGNLYRQQPKIFSQQHPEVLQMLFSSFNTVDPALLGVLIATIGKVGSSDEGKRVLLSYEDETQSFFHKMGEIMERKNALCVTALTTMTALMFTEDEELTHVCEKWFLALGNSAPSLLFDIIKLPFADIKLAGLQLFQSICRFPWGRALVVQVGGLVEFVLDREAEFDHECRTTKFNVVQALASHPPPSISNELLNKIRQHVIDGPYYKSLEPQTAVEEA